MADTTSGFRTSYQGSGSNTRREFDRGRGNSDGKGWYRGFYSTKSKVWGKCEYLGSNIYLIVDTQQAYK